MNIELPAPIAGFFQAHNTGKTDYFKDLFTPDAVVSDEAHEYRGDAIKPWIDDAISKYRLEGTTPLGLAGIRADYPG
jgi:hypothetical protein